LINRVYNDFILISKAKYDNIKELLKYITIPDTTIFDKTLEPAAARDGLEAFLDEE
jgi:hypothetical protein